MVVVLQYFIDEGGGVIPHSQGRAAKSINIQTLVPVLCLLLVAAVLPVGEVGLIPQILSTLLILYESSLLWWHFTQWNSNRLLSNWCLSAILQALYFLRGWGLCRVQINKQVVAATVLLCTRKHS